MEVPIRAPRLFAAAVALAICGCSFDYDGAFTAATAGSGGHGGKGAGGHGGLATGGTSAFTAGSGGASASTSEAASSSSGCVEPVLPCGANNGDPCCVCTGGTCGPNLTCVGGIGGTCQCGNTSGQPCCGGVGCNSNNPYLTCIGGTCLNCCGQCKGDPGLLKHDFASTGGKCPLAVENRCEKVNGCNGAPPNPPCCAYSCVIQPGTWNVCP